ncbi:MAG: glycosyltransferase family 2 protein [Clostridia bacterium]|nr:glycosyltransferase family 2 protein [Clostridia bacterium]
MKLSLVVPCYNEQDNVEKFYTETVKAFSGSDFSYEFVFVNDGSKDNTLKQLKKLYDEHKESNIKVIGFSRNFGKEAAMYAGLSNAKGDYVCVIDADLQQRPEVALQMVNILDENEEYDCVAAYQEERKESKMMITLKNAFYKLINKVTEVDFVSGASDFRTFRRSMVEAILNMTEYHRFSKGIFSWVGFNTKFIPYEVQERESGVSNWNVWKLFKYAMEGIISFTTAPLKFATGIGTLAFFASIIYTLIIIIKHFVWGVDVAGYDSIVALILMFGGLQLLCIGILGEYLAKVYVQVKNRPVYIISKMYSYEEDK